MSNTTLHNTKKDTNYINSIHITTVIKRKRNYQTSTAPSNDQALKV